MNAPPHELEKSGLQAARDARHEVAALMQEVAAEEPALGKRLSGVVATLFSAEVGNATKVHAALERATEGLRELLDEPTNVERDGIAKTLSRALALIHPARSALGRSLGVAGLREDATEPFLLTSARVKPSSSPPPMGDERRRDMRRSELEVEVGLEGDNRFYTGRTGDISKGGLFVSTDTPLIVGTELVLTFVLPDGYRVRADATVAWVRAPRYRPHELPSGMGVRFEELGPGDRNALAHFLTSRPAFHYGD